MFGVILPSRPVLGPSTLQTISETQFAYSFPAAPAFSHLVVFLLPENTLPPDVLAGIYIQFPGGEFKLLGGLSHEKQSAIFRVSAPRTASAGAGPSGTNGQMIGEIGGVAEVDMDADESAPPAASSSTAQGNVTVGISIEPAATLQPQLAALSIGAAASAGASAPKPSPPETKVLAQRIIRHAFNFLSSFTGADGKVPLKSFEDWWKKFESRIDADPTFLERQEDG